MHHQGRRAGYENDDPCAQDCLESVGGGADRDGADGVDDGQKAIERHQDERVDAGVGAHHDQVLNDLAPDVAERPVRKSVIQCRERHTKGDEKKIGDSQVDNEQISRGAHLRVEKNDDDDQSIADESDDDDDGEQDRDDDRNDSLARKRQLERIRVVGIAEAVVEEILPILESFERLALHSVADDGHVDAFVWPNNKTLINNESKLRSERDLSIIHRLNPEHALSK